MDWSRIKAVVFDLDNTLIDHSAAEQAAIERLLPLYADDSPIGEILKNSPAHFISAYRRWNEILWRKLAMREISAEELKWRRFASALTECAPEAAENRIVELGREMGEEYLRLYAEHWRAFPEADETLGALAARYRLGLITNGFSEQQRAKLARFGWATRFDALALSDEVGVMKPHKPIFDYILARLELESEEVVYVGDHYESDIAGAQNAYWRAIWFNPARKEREENRADATVASLGELVNVLFAS
jgi:YjjG family noncanonical pyrimidine nucleotidase